MSLGTHSQVPHFRDMLIEMPGKSEPLDFHLFISHSPNDVLYRNKICASISAVEDHHELTLLRISQELAEGMAQSATI